jgi:hypothetical protein
VSDARFGAITARLWEKLRVESLKSIGGKSVAADGGTLS